MRKMQIGYLAIAAMVALSACSKDDNPEYVPPTGSQLPKPSGAVDDFTLEAGYLSTLMTPIPNDANNLIYICLSIKNTPVPVFEVGRLPYDAPQEVRIAYVSPSTDVFSVTSIPANAQWRESIPAADGCYLIRYEWEGSTYYSVIACTLNYTDGVVVSFNGSYVYETSYLL